MKAKKKEQHLKKQGLKAGKTRPASPKLEATLHRTATTARKKAYAPYSKFKVGAAVGTTGGEVFSGCNVENASYGGTVCAERTAILKAVTEGHFEFKEIVVVTNSSAPAFPCALCLQTMAEFFSPGTAILIANTKKIVSRHRFGELLPFPFGPAQLRGARK